MKEILFRGKTKDGKWVEGDFVRIKDGDIITPYIYYHGEVIEKTVGQFTGLTDKNGKKIFEGDIVKEKDCVHNGEIQIKGNVFKIRFLDNGIFCADNGGWWEFIDEIGEIEIIGNIHDNPELINIE